MKKFTLLSILIAGLLLSGCKKTTEITITPENAGEVVVVNSDNSDLSDFFDAQPNTYEVLSLNDTLQVSISFIVNKDVKEFMRGEFESFVLIPMNDDKAALGDMVFTACEGKEMSNLLFASAVGANVTVKFQYVPVNDDEKNTILENISFCKVELNLADMVFEEIDDEPGYDDYMDMYVQAEVDGDEEVAIATAENIAEAQMEGLLTPEQETRWTNIDKEVEKAKSAK